MRGRVCVCVCVCERERGWGWQLAARAHDALYSPPAGQLEAALQKGLGTLPEKGQPPGLSQFTSVTYSLAPGNSSILRCSCILLTIEVNIQTPQPSCQRIAN